MAQILEILSNGIYLIIVRQKNSEGHEALKNLYWLDLNWIVLLEFCK